MTDFFKWFVINRPPDLTDREWLAHQLACVHAEARKEDRRKRAENRYIANTRWPAIAEFILETSEKMNARYAETNRRCDA